MADEPDVVALVERVTDAAGEVAELQRRGPHLEAVLGGARTLYSDVLRNEAQLADLALAPLAGRDDISVLIGGLNLGRVLAAVLATRGVARVDVIEPWEPLLKWHEGELRELSAAALADSRVHLHRGEFVDLLAARKKIEGAPPDGWLALILDLDEGPQHPARASHRQIFEPASLAQLRDAICPGGVIATWAREKSPVLLTQLGKILQSVVEIVVPVDIGSKTGLDFFYRGRRPPRQKHEARSNN